MYNVVILFDLYNHNKDFKEYVDKFAKKHNRLFPEDCFHDAIVINYAEFLLKGDK